MARVIAPRFGAKVDVSEDFSVCIKQYREGACDQLVILHREEARELIQMLESEIRLAEELEEQEAENA